MRNRIENLSAEINKTKILPENKKTIFKFDEELTINKRKTPTRLHYLFLLKRLGGFFPQKKFKELKKEDLIKFLTHFKPVEKNKTEYSSTSLLVYHACIKKFFKWLYDSDEYPKIVKWIKVERKEKLKLPSDMATQDEIKKLVEAADHPRDKALVMVLYETGGRPSEITGLNLKDVKEDEYGIFLIFPDVKTGQRRVRLLNAIPDLKIWLNYHKFKDTPENPLFYAIGKKWHGKCVRIGIDAIEQLLKRLLKQAGITKRIFPYIMRHTRLTELAKMGFRESELRILAGWSADSRMPRIYIHLSGEDVDKKFLELNGKIVKQTKMEQKLKPRICIRCENENPATAMYCVNCFYPLDKNAINEIELLKHEIQKEISKMLEKLDLQKTLSVAIEKSKQK